MTSTNKSITINATNDQLPILGFGTGTQWRIKKEQDSGFIAELADQISEAINTGFRHIDTAERYLTHAEVGEGIKKAKVSREELWVTDKYSPFHESKSANPGPLESLQGALRDLQLNYVDLYMLHSPIIEKENSGVNLREAWEQMEKIYELGLARNIGVSNFPVKYLEEIRSWAKYMPMVNQLEYNAYLQDQSPSIIDYCKEHEIAMQAYSPLSPITRARPGPLDDILPKLAEKYNRSETQILLRWVVQKGLGVLTTSSRRERLVEALSIFEFELDAEDMELITETGKKKHYRWCLKKIFASCELPHV